MNSEESKKSKRIKRIKKIGFLIVVVVLALVAALISQHNKWGSFYGNLFFAISFLASAYLLLFDSFVEEVGKQSAELMFLKEKTKIESEVKKGFNEALVQLEADLSRRNITYEVGYSVYYTERSKSLIDLYRKLSRVYSTGFYLATIWKLYSLDKSIDAKVYKSMKDESVDKYVESLHQATSALDFCRLFLDKALYSKIQKLNTDINKSK